MGFTIAFKLNHRRTIGRPLDQYGAQAPPAHLAIVSSADSADGFSSLRVGRGDGRAQYFTFMMDSASSLLIETYVENLIQEIEKRPALYKKNLKEYSDVNKKKKLWEEVCEAVVPNWNELSAEDKTKQGKHRSFLF